MPYFTERDIEIPKLFEFIDKHSNEIVTVLDVGCYGSQYLNQLRNYSFSVDGIDIGSREKEKEFLRNYFVGNFLKYPLEQYDLVVSVSTLEHAGILPHKVKDYVEEQYNFFKKIIDTSRKFTYVTFPYGVFCFHPESCANMTRERLNAFLKLLWNFNYKLSFYYVDDPHAGFGWTEITQDAADKVELGHGIGVRCVCILEIKK